ncbi:MAG TPA: hypothetical protein VGA36_08160 [Nitriliruptorales bacterium]
MRPRRVVAMLVGVLLALLFVSPASATGALDSSFRTGGVAARTPQDRPVVMVGEPSRPCAAPAFVRPIDQVDQGVLADTGVRWGLVVVALTALAMAALLAPRRAWASLKPPDPPRPREGQD